MRGEKSTWKARTLIHVPSKITQGEHSFWDALKLQEDGNGVSCSFLMGIAESFFIWSCFFFFYAIRRVPITIGTLTVASIILTCCLIVVMANEFPVLPDKLIRWSDTFSSSWKDRSIFVVLVIATVSLATGLTMVSVSWWKMRNKSFSFASLY